MHTLDGIRDGWAVADEAAQYLLNAVKFHESGFESAELMYSVDLPQEPVDLNPLSLRYSMKIVVDADRKKSKTLRAKMSIRYIHSIASNCYLKALIVMPNSPVSKKATTVLLSVSMANRTLFISQEVSVMIFKTQQTKLIKKLYKMQYIKRQIGI